MRAPNGGAYGYSRHKNRMPGLYGGTLKEVLPRSEALVNTVPRFGADSLVKCLSGNSNPGPTEDRTGIAFAASGGAVS